MLWEQQWHSSWPNMCFNTAKPTDVVKNKPNRGEYTKLVFGVDNVDPYETH